MELELEVSESEDFHLVRLLSKDHCAITAREKQLLQDCV